MIAGRSMRWKSNKRKGSQMDISPRWLCLRCHRLPPRRPCPRFYPLLPHSLDVVFDGGTLEWTVHRDLDLDRDREYHCDVGYRTSTEWDDGEDDGLTCRHDRIHRDPSSFVRWCVFVSFCTER